MRTKAIAAVAAVLLGLALATQAVAQEVEVERPRPLPARMGPIQRALAEMDLSAEQLKEIESIMQAYTEEMRAHREAFGSVRPLMQEMRELQRAGNEEAAQKKRAEIEKLTAPMRELERTYVEKVKAVMTEEQAANFEKKLRESRPYGRRGPGGGAGEPGVGPEGPGPGPGPVVPPVPGGPAPEGALRERVRDVLDLEELNLTNEQKEKIKELRENQQEEYPELKADMERLKALTEELRELRREQPPDHEKMREKREEMREIGGRLRESQEAFREGLKKILTVEQHEKLGQLLENARRREGQGPGVVFDRLNLADEQKQKISSLREGLLGKVREAREKIDKNEEETRGLLEQIRTYHEEFEQAVLRLLTPEQKEQYEKYVAERRERMRQRAEGTERPGPERRDFIHTPPPPDFEF